VADRKEKKDPGPNSEEVIRRAELGGSLWVLGGQACQTRKTVLKWGIGGRVCRGSKNDYGRGFSRQNRSGEKGREFYAQNPPAKTKKPKRDESPKAGL